MGLGTGIGAIAVIGFFILLGILLKGGSLGGNKGADSYGAPANTGGSPTAAAPSHGGGGAGQIQVQPITSSDHVRGNRNAKVTIVEYSDIDCPFCQRIHDTLKQVVNTYDGDVSWVYRHFPLTSLHPNAATKAEATECVAELGGEETFWEYIDILFARNESVAELGDIAAEVGVDKGAFETCMSEGRHQGTVRDQYNQATAAGGTGTPYSIIIAGDEQIPVSGAVPFAQFQQQIDSLL